MSDSNDNRPVFPIQDILARYGGAAMERELALAAVVNGREWTLNLEEGTMSFGPGLDFTVQVLGTYLNEPEPGRWVWGWDDEFQDYLPTDDEWLQNANLLGRMGHQHNIKAFRESGVPMNPDGLTFLSLVVTGFLRVQTQGYYLARHSAGQLLVLLDDGPVPKTESASSAHLAEVLTHLTAKFPFDHRTAVTEYAQDWGYEVESNGPHLRATHGEEVLTAEFDEEGHLIGLNGERLWAED